MKSLRFLIIKYIKIIFPFSILMFFLGCSGSIDTKPNVIVIYTDDQEFNQLGCFGGDVLTPNIDRLAENGVKFNNYYATSPVCTPSRYSLLTGRYAGKCDELERKYPVSEPAFIRWNTFIDENEKTVVDILKENGYSTGLVGKYHIFDNESIQAQLPLDSNPEIDSVKKVLEENYDLVCSEIKKTAGFDYVGSVYANNHHALGAPKVLQEHNQEWITKSAVEFIDQNKANPFFLYLSLTLPHEPLPLKSLKSDIRTTPKGFIEGLENIQPSRETIFERVKAAGFADSVAPFTWMDDGIGTVIAKLKETNTLENTIIIFASDHGSVRGKMTCYQSAAKAPAFIYYPKSLNPKTMERSIVANIDIVPTILDMCSINNTNYDYDGKSLIPLIKGEDKDWRKSLMLEVTYTRGVVTNDWKYIAIRYPEKIAKQINKENRREFNQEGTRLSSRTIHGPAKVRYDAQNDFPGYYDYNQLYDLNNDPLEQNNLAKKEEYQEALKNMKSLLTKHSKKLPHKFGEF